MRCGGGSDLFSVCFPIYSAKCTDWIPDAEWPSTSRAAQSGLRINKDENISH